MIEMRDPRTRLLQAIDRFHCLNTVQAGKIAGYKVSYKKDGSYTTVSMHLTDLFNDGLVDYGMLSHETAQGGVTKLFVLTSNGREALRQLKIEVTSDRSPFRTINLVGKMQEKARRAEPGEAKGLKAKKLDDYWRHVMHSTEVLVTAHMWRAAHREVEFRRMLTEPDINRDKNFPVTIRMVNGRPEGVKPDGLLEVVYPGLGGYRLWIELEHGSYREVSFKQKVRDLITFAQGPNEQLFGTRTLTILFIASQGEDHREELCKWIHQVWREMEDQGPAVLFRVTSAPIDDVRLFDDASWFIPGDYDAHLLFE